MWNERLKLSLVLTFLSIFILAVAVKIVYLQIYKHSRLSEYAESQSVRKITVHENRGIIADRSGEKLAMNKKTASLFVYGRDVEDAYRVKLIFKDHGISIGRSNYNRMKSRTGFIWLKRNVDIATAKAISERYSYIHYVLQESRYYPSGESVAKIVGFTGVDNQGLQGVEYFFDEELKGSKKEIYYLRDSKNRPILLEDKEYISEPSSKIYLTIDKRYQSIAANILKKDLRRFGAKKGLAAGIDIKTGEILFSASFPSYDPSAFSSFPKKRWKTMLYNYLFEPGSIFKAFTFGFLLENDLINLQEEIDCENGNYMVYNHVFNDVHKYGNLKAEDVFVKSSNIGTIKLTEDTPREDFYNFLKSLHIGEKIGGRATGSEKGILRNYSDWSGLSKPSISIGQEILVTPLHILQYYSAIANNGILVEPHLIKKVFTERDNYLFEAKKERILSSKSSETLKRLLRETVETGTGKNSDSEYIKISAKTGTAQKYEVKNGTYSYRDYVASFVGFFPYENPEIAMIVLYDSPSKSIYGGSTAAYTFKSIAEQVMLNMGYKIKHLRAEIETKKAS